MTIEKPFYTAPSGDPDKDPQYIDPKELEQIFRSIPVSEMVKLNESLKLHELSMGMSEDYLKAVEFESTYLRIGSKIFGKRN